MSNSILTLDVITRESVELFKNTNNFLMSIPTQYDDTYGVEGAKQGDSLRIRLPNDYIVTDGPGLSVQDTAEQKVVLTVSYQRHIDVGFSTKERTLSLDDYEERILMPQLNALAGNVAAQIMGGIEPGCCNLVSNTDGSGNIITPIADTFLSANANLDDNSAPTMRRYMTVDPTTDARTASSLSGLLNPVTEISEQYRRGAMKNGLGFDWLKDQTVIKHTTGTFSAGTVSGANQTGLTLTVNAITGTLNQGDIITLAGVNGVNRVTKQDQGTLRQFVVTAAVLSGATSIPIYPAIVPPNPVDGSVVQYQTVTTSPANAATILLTTPASSVYRKNFAFAPEALTMATADLVAPSQGVVEVARHMYDGISMRMLTSYIPNTDQLVTRLDVLFGYVFLRPEWVVCVAASI